MEPNFREIAQKWQQKWREQGLYKTEVDPSKPKYYVLDMFPYPSGAGLHVGHPLGYIASDIVSRFKRLKGFNVLHPMGFDAFGLPAEQYAIQTGRHPADTTAENIARYKEQLNNIGFCYDWNREVNTSDPQYYKWTQWIFLQLFNCWFNNETQKAEPIAELELRFASGGSAGVNGACGEHEPFSAGDWANMDEAARRHIVMQYRLAYLDYATVNWCEALGTVLANDEVKDGLSERGGHPVEKRKMRQWFLRITAYAERLLSDLESLDWTDSMKEMQRNWIGKSEGAMVKFYLSPNPSPQERGTASVAASGIGIQNSGGQERGTVDNDTSAYSHNNVEDPLNPYHHANPKAWMSLIAKAKEMRSNMTPSEKRLWEQLRAGKSGYKFRRQHIIAGFIVDFVCLSAGLVIEVDGNVHNSQKEADEGRTTELNNHGFEVIRFSNDEVDGDVLLVVDKIVDECKRRGFFPKLEQYHLVEEPDGEYSATPGSGFTFFENPESPQSLQVTSKGLGQGQILPSPRGEGSGERSNENSESPQPLQVTSKGLIQGEILPSPRGEGSGERFHENSESPLPLEGASKGLVQGEILPSPRGEGSGERFIEVFTTRPDTLFGVDFLTLAPEHELVAEITTAEQKAAVEAYVAVARNRSERERMSEVKRISGEFTGAYAIHPFTGKPIPVWVGDYVLAGYGTGAVMAVPAGDQRDWDFAKHFGIPMTEIHEGIEISEAADPTKDAKLKNSGFLNGLTGHEAIRRAVQEIEAKGIGKGKVNYRLRDAGFSRQRYWGEPFPIEYRNGVAYALNENELPLELPVMDDFKPTGQPESPLAKATHWLETPSGRRETDTMPGYAGSSWYFLRYMDAQNTKRFVGREAEAYWQDVDVYIGGTEHAVGHLLYARFWQKFLFDRGEVTKNEPFRKLINQGMILGRSNFVYRISGENKYISADLIQQNPDVKTIPLHVDVNIVRNDVLDTEAFRRWRPENNNVEFVLNADGQYVCGVEVEKMSKSKYNVVNPDDIIAEYGADTLRLYEMFLGPLEQSKPWNTNGIEGVYRFFKKLWNLFYNEQGGLKLSDEPATEEELRILHKTIRKVEEDIERFSFNTSVSTFMICVNELHELKCRKRSVLQDFLIILSPYAPHIAEELWQASGGQGSVVNARFPEWKEEFIRESKVTYPVAFNGKTRYQIQVPAEMPQAEVQALALGHEEASKWLNGGQPKKVIVVPGRMVNIVL
jgi:leucyl-tRNA synthetase